MEVYAKLNKESRRKIVQDEQAKFYSALLPSQNDPTAFVSAIYSFLGASALTSTTLPSTVIKQKALFQAAGQFSLFPQFVGSIESPAHRDFFQLTDKSLLPPNAAVTPQAQWVAAVIQNLHAICQIARAARSQPETQRAAQRVLKPILAKNFAAAGIVGFIREMPLGKEEPEFVFLVRTIVYMLIKEPTLMNVSTDISTVIPRHNLPAVADSALSRPNSVRSRPQQAQGQGSRPLRH